MYAFEALLSEHRKIMAQGDALRRITSGRPDAGTAHAALTRLSETLVAHLTAEDDDLYPMLMISKDASAAHAAAESARHHETLRADWRDYVAGWPRAKIDKDWQGFTAATAAILDRLACRIECENELLYPFALRAMDIRLRA